MAIVRSLVVLSRKSAIPRDQIVNSWHFGTPPGAVTGTMLANISTELTNFYVTLNPYLSQVISNDLAVHLIKHYLVTPGAPGAADDTTGSPLQTDSFTLTPAPTKSPFPSEVAVCLSYRGNLTGIQEESGGFRPAARRRGRIYIGPLNESAYLMDPVIKEPKVNPGFRTLLTQQANVLHDALDANGIAWGIYSRAGASFTDAESVYVDDAFDTIRSRGERATSRTTMQL